MTQLQKDNWILLKACIILISFTFFLNPIQTMAADKSAKDSKSSTKKGKGKQDQKSKSSKSGSSASSFTKVIKDTRSTKTFEAIGGGAYMDGVVAPSGNLGYFVTPDILLETGLFLGVLKPDKKYLDGFAQGKLFVFKSVFITLGGGIGKLDITHKDKVWDGYEDWKESAIKMRGYGGAGVQFFISFISFGFQASGGYSMVLGKVSNNIPVSQETGKPVATRDMTIKSGVSVNAYAFGGFAF